MGKTNQEILKIFLALWRFSFSEAADHPTTFTKINIPPQVFLIYNKTNDPKLQTTPHMYARFDLTAQDSYFMNLVEIFTNCILAEITYFTNHEQKNTVWKEVWCQKILSWFYATRGILICPVFLDIKGLP